MRVDMLNSWIVPQAARDAAPGAAGKAEEAALAGAAAPAATVEAPPPAAASADAGSDESADDNKEQSLLERILAHGFSQFAEDMKAETIQRMREEMLTAMGFTEEDLENMPPEQRKMIEDMIADEIKRRMEAAAEMDGGEKEQTTMPNKGDAGLAKLSGTALSEDSVSPATGAGVGMGLPANMGLGPLLALQEVDAEKAGDTTPGKANDSDDRPGKKDREIL